MPAAGAGSVLIAGSATASKTKLATGAGTTSLTGSATAGKSKPVAGAGSVSIAGLAIASKISRAQATVAKSVSGSGLTRINGAGLIGYNHAAGRGQVFMTGSGMAMLITPADLQTIVRLSAIRHRAVLDAAISRPNWSVQRTIAHFVITLQKSHPTAQRCGPVKLRGN